MIQINKWNIYLGSIDHGNGLHEAVAVLTAAEWSISVGGAHGGAVVVDLLHQVLGEGHYLKRSHELNLELNQIKHLEKKHKMNFNQNTNLRIISMCPFVVLKHKEKDPRR